MLRNHSDQHVVRCCSIIFSILTYCVLSLNTGVVAQEIDALAKQLSSVDLNERRDAAYALADAGPEALPAIQQLAQALEDQDAQVWFQSITAIGKLGPDAIGVAKQVVAHLDSDSQQRRYRAAWCLSSIGCKALPIISESLTDASVRHREAAMLAIGSMGDSCGEEAAELLGAASHDQNVEVALAAVKSMVDRKNADLLTDVLLDPREELIEAAAKGLSTLTEIPNTANNLLIRQSESDNVAVRAAAISAMSTATIDQATLEEILSKNLQSAHPSITNAVILLLKRNQGSPFLVHAVCTGLQSEDPDVRSEAAQILASSAVGSEVAEQALLQVLSRSTSDTSKIIDAITRMGDHMAEALLAHDSQSDELERKLALAIAALDQSVIPQLLAALKSDLSFVSARAANALAAMDSLTTQVIDELVNSLDHPISEVRVACLKALRGQAELPAGVIDKVHALAGSGDPLTMMAAISVLAQVDPLSERSTLIFDRASGDSRPELRKVLLDGMVKNASLGDHYSDFLGHSLSDPNPVIRLAAVKVLVSRERCSPPFQEQIFRLVHDDSSAIRLAAVEAISFVDEKTPVLAEQIAHILPVADETMLVQLLDVLKQFEKTASGQFSEVAGYLSHESSEVRSAAVICLTGIAEEPKEAIQAILPMLKDSDWIVRKSAAQSLGSFESAAKAAVPSLFLMLQSEIDEDAARGALRSIDDAGPEALDVLLSGLDSDDRRIRFYAMFLIGKIGPQAKPAIPKLESMLNETESGRFRETIQQAIDRIKSE